MGRPFLICSRPIAFAAVASFVVATCVDRAAGWGRVGHEFITSEAIVHLPLPLRGFFARNESNIATQGGIEPPGTHFIDIDEYPEFFAGTLPREKNDLIAIYGAAKVEDVGTGPWTYVSLIDQLSQAMRAAQTAAQWQALIPTAGAMAHYIEDLHNPLHLTRNYNGQYSGNSGIHSRYESNMISRHTADLGVTPAAAQYIESPLNFVFDGIDEHYDFVDDIIAADSAAPRPTNSNAYYDSLWASTGGFTKDLFQDASEAVASSWYTAWVNAGSRRTFLTHTADFEADGDVDRFDLAVWQSEYGASSIADANGDGSTDGADLLLWQRQQGAIGVAAALGAIPEPASCQQALGAIAGVAGALRRDRRAPRPGRPS